MSNFLVWLCKPIIVWYNIYSRSKIVEISNDIVVSKELEEILNERVVLRGPFKGLKFPPIPRHIMHYNFASLILGTYESELHDWIYEIIKKKEKFKSIINIGSGAGYYVIGFAVNANYRDVIAIDTSYFSNRYLNKNLSINAREKQVLVATDLNNIDAEKYLSGRNLWFIDCEGCEQEILFNRNIDFSMSDIIVETHEFVHFDIVEDIKKEFSDTHVIEFAKSVPDMRKVKEYKIDLLESETRAAKFNLLAERRNVDMNWVYLKSKYKHVK